VTVEVWHFREPVSIFTPVNAVASRKMIGAFVFVLVFAFQRLRSGLFEEPATVKPPALPADTYMRRNSRLRNIQ
jgi:hypothetical protein